MPTPTPKYKICRNCGNRNHPRSGQCPWCGATLRRPLDWFSTLGLVLIVLIILGLIAYSLSNRPPSGAKMRLPRLGADDAVPAEAAPGAN